MVKLEGISEADFLRSQLAEREAALQFMQVQIQSAVASIDQFKSLAMMTIVALGTGADGVFTGEISEQQLTRLPQEYFLEQAHDRRSGTLRLSVITPEAGAVFTEIKKKHEEAQQQQLEQLGLAPKKPSIIV